MHLKKVHDKLDPQQSSPTIVPSALVKEGTARLDSRDFRIHTMYPKLIFYSIGN